MDIDCWQGALSGAILRLSFPSNKTLGATMFLDVLGARSLEVQHLQPIILENKPNFWLRRENISIDRCTV